ncbi:MAG: hypothetical protein KAU22_03785, partial [Desulfuromonadales bacterium]|nr:hypothetical protein [Desulfuromonadales bacterium]
VTEDGGGNLSQTSSGISNTTAIVNAIAAVDSSESGSLIAGNKVFISAQHLNINGYVQSGFQDKSVTIAATGTVAGDDVQRQIEGFELDYHNKIAAGQVVSPYYLLDLGANAVNVGRIVYYNALENCIEIKDITIQGGFIQLYGDIVNTGSGTLQALDGYGQIAIENNSDYEIVINNLNAGQEIEGVIKIIDTAKDTTTFYRHIGDDIVVETIDSVGGTTETTISDTSNTTYQPEAGQRYTWVTGQSKTVVEIFKDWDNSLNLFLFTIDTTSTDFSTWQSSEYYTDPTALEEGVYYSVDTSVPNFVYEYSYVIEEGSAQVEVPDSQLDNLEDTIGINLRSENPYQEDDTFWRWEDHGGYVWTPWGDEWISFWVYVPVHQSYAEVVMWQPVKDIRTNTIAADNPINIEFSGYDSGKVEIVSREDVTLQGSILNDDGVTIIRSDGSIERAANVSSAIINTPDLQLYAGTGIGTEQALLTKLEGGAITAYTASGDIAIQELLGDMTVRNIEIPFFDPFASAAEILEFSPADTVDSTNYTIEFAAAHGLVTGDSVRYSSDGGSAIAGLISGSNYKALVVNTTTVMLAVDSTATAALEAGAEALQSDGVRAVENLVIHIDATGATGLSHSLTHGDGIADSVTADTGAGATITSGVITFTIDHDFIDGQAVVYSSNGGAVIPGLVEGETYYVSVVNGRSIRLSGDRDSIISYLPQLVALDGDTATGFDHSFELSDGGTVVSINPFTLATRSELTIGSGGGLNTSSETIDFGYAHVLSTGDYVTYIEGSSALTGLTDGSGYYAIVTGTETLQLAISAAAANAGTAINLSGTATDFTLLSEQQRETESFSFDPTTAIGAYASTFIFSSDHGYIQDQSVVYSDSGDGDSITNLVSGTTYYIDVVDTRTIRLTDSVGGMVIEIGVPSTLATNYTFTTSKGQSVTLAAAAGKVVVFAPQDSSSADTASGWLTLSSNHGFASGDWVTYEMA